MSTTIYQLDAGDRSLLARYSELDTGSGAVFRDLDCVTLVDGRREIAEAEIARHS